MCSDNGDVLVSTWWANMHSMVPIDEQAVTYVLNDSECMMNRWNSASCARDNDGVLVWNRCENMHSMTACDADTDR